MEWFYRVMGSKDKKTNKMKYYRVKVKDHTITDCNCDARMFRRHQPCKHMKSINERLGHSL
jgi:hypothetical protein